MMLGDHGADVIKVEPPAATRRARWGPPFVDGESTYYLGINRNKRSLALDLATERGQDIAAPPGVDQPTCWSRTFARARWSAWGSATRRCRELNPRLIYLSISGFGRERTVRQRRRLRRRAAGVRRLHEHQRRGRRRAAQGRHRVADLATGLFASQAILLALHARQQTGWASRWRSRCWSRCWRCCTRTSSSYLNAGLVGQAARQQPPDDRPVRPDPDRGSADLSARRQRRPGAPAGRGHRPTRARGRSALSHEPGPRCASARAAGHSARRSSASGRRWSCAGGCGTRRSRLAR